MNFLDSLMSYWTYAHVQANILIALNLAGALVLGLILGYERSYHGRAAGMRTYGLVCMVSAGIVLVSGYPELWYGAQFANSDFHVDPTRSIQGIVTGISFLCAGVIMKDGFSISGLTTAASIWTVVAVGILVGVGLFLAAICMVIGAIVCMTIVSNIEGRLPSRHAIAVTLKFREAFTPDLGVIRAAIGQRGYLLAQGSITIAHAEGQFEWHFVILVVDSTRRATLPNLSDVLLSLEGVQGFQIAHARN